MQIIRFLIFALAVSPAISLAKWADKSDLETAEMAVCTAAVMKAGMGIEPYRKWAKALNNRYQKIYQDKSPNEIDKYTSERIVDKRAELQRRGISSKAAFKRFYETNCKESHP